MDEYKEDRMLCYVLSYQCGIIFSGILIILAFIFYVVEFAFMVMNDFFYPIFPVLYGIVLLPIALACLVFICYFFNTKEPKTRRFLPEAILATGICSLLLALWIFIYVALLD